MAPSRTGIAPSIVWPPVVGHGRSMTVQVVVMGVAGAGKSTVAVDLATSPEQTSSTVTICIPSPMSPRCVRDTVDRRRSRAVARRDRGLLSGRADAGRTGVVACPGLRKDYRDRLRPDGLDVQFVHLDGEFETISA
ncbi:unnamed protein product, partial [Mesorhabditis spiculigera]